MAINKIEWLTADEVTVGKFKIYCVSNLNDGYNQGSGIKRTKKHKMILKRVFWPLLKLRNDLFIDGFIEREIGKLIENYINKKSVFLEIGCGDMSLRKFIPNDLWYNAFDLELSDFHILRVLKEKQNINIALASATEIPIPSDTVSLIVSTETFEHIPEIEKAIQEIYRIATHNAIIICSIPNNYCKKYNIKGKNTQHINNWTFDTFIEFMKSFNIFFVKGFMKGKWISLPLWLTDTSYQLPFSSKLEFHNTNFFYVFRVNKALGD